MNNAAGDSPEWSELDPKISALVREIIARIADKWTLLIIEALHEYPDARFNQLQRMVEGISQKVLTQSLRQLESDGLIQRTAYAETPPRVEYKLTPLGESLGEAFCGVWIWAERHWEEIEASLAAFAAKKMLKEKS
ncbi:winged helix-turn-helix transcriptional regulator [Blastopirellula marina]|uniref:Putative transcriptional regulator n=1 Tax=Blastopirellula marina DSM 3645 TaxID=314230 RepID=A3ZNI4_9BACT|nr:helix-turn-helix domain-containing protein [Blastopirellula marina]EAQ81879.1 putative transcriptional regulator [Blastopirellula marina DSM 3645]